jgi:DNA-binding LytR/AlgR family response regulator
VVTASDEAIIRTPLKELLDMLDEDTFWQIHRGTIVRVSAIARLRKNELGRAELALKQRAEVLAVGASYLHRFRGM